MESEKVVVDELPLAVVRRVVKTKLTECSPDYDVSIHKEALLGFAESARIFIHYLSATANDFCKDSKRQTMKADDVYKALEEMEFSEFLEPLKASLEEFKKKNAGKKAAGGTTPKPSGEAASKPQETKKRKHEGPSVQKSVRKSKVDEVEDKNDEENETDNVEESGDVEDIENDDENTEENGNDEEDDNEVEDEENGNEGDSMEENGNEGNSMEENGNASENEDISMEENRSESGEEEEDDEEDE